MEKQKKMDVRMQSNVLNPWTLSRKDIVDRLGSNGEHGLDVDQVRRLREQYGPNVLRQVERKSVWQILIHQFKSLIMLLLAVAAILSLAFGDWVDALAIGGVIVINTGIGLFMELRAVRSMEALRRLERVTARVRRAGQVIEVRAQEVVPGDIVLIEGGDLISADMRVLQASKLQVDESVLTGESLPVLKQTDPLDADAPLGDRTNMLFKGTAITRGSGEAVVTATGMNTELGEISSLVREAQESVTPLERRLALLARKLLWVTMLIIVIVAVTGIARGKEVVIMIETAIALAVAAIPEGLPIVATLALARGMIRMAKHNALVNELGAVETLGGTSVICTDKTGTLTENKMTVVEVVLEDGPVTIGQTVDLHQNDPLREALEVSVLCNNASLTSSGQPHSGLGDPLEVALLVAARKAGIDGDDLRQRFPEEREDAFDSDTKVMATFNRSPEGYRVAVKGAFEEVLASCSSVRMNTGAEPLNEDRGRHWLDTNTKLTEQGRRVLALASKQVSSVDAPPYEDLCFLGLVVMEDPPRSDVPDAIRACRQAGIRVVMITGDHPKTAFSIASAVGLTDDETHKVVVGKDIVSADRMSAQDREHYRATSVFARVSPRQKLDLIDVHQQFGSVVAMTGDGVNDAPALKKANIGIAMGQRGTQVAREAADMVLKDDAFATIVVAVQQGRVIFDNIRRFVLYLLSCNVSEVMIVFAASLVNAPLPILPLQILFLNLVTDVFPALALGVAKVDPRVMERKPRRPEEPILPTGQWFSIAGYGVLITFSVLLAFAVALKAFSVDTERAVTVSFLTLALSQLWHVFNMRGTGSGILRNEITRSRYVWGAVGLCVGLLLIAIYVPIVASVMGLTRPSLREWLLVLLCSALTWVVGQGVKTVAANVRAESSDKSTHRAAG
ncbi:MAG: cation-translocating P-type ATPase [Planctomycetota bacterium]|jgi:Ca2+-transporting ATPase